MILEALKQERVHDFVAYCKKHRKMVDDSFLYDEDLKDFQPNAENPTFIVVNDAGKVVAAVSLMIDDYHRLGKKARFRIFHSEVKDLVYYHLLMQAVLTQTAGLDKLFVFAPMKNQDMAEFMEQLHFSIERQAFVLVREGLAVPEIDLPEVFTIRAFVPGQDEEIWCEIRNAGFANLKGSETPVSPEVIAKMVAGKDYLEGGMMILFHKEKPVGVVMGGVDEYEGESIMNIGPLAILPAYQRKGLGRILLRASLNFANEKSFKRTILSVNGENERAISLYIQEGFCQVEGYTCFVYDLGPKD